MFDTDTEKVDYRTDGGKKSTLVHFGRDNLKPDFLVGYSKRSSNPILNTLNPDIFRKAYER